MNRWSIPVLVLALAPTLTFAQATRTWVSGVGDDVNPCSRTAPCKTFAGAISKTAAGGEIDALDPGGFGTVTITKSITIDGSGTFASILSSGTNGVNVNAAGIVVVLRGLSIQGAGVAPGLNGVNFVEGSSVRIEDCVISGFSQTGVSATKGRVEVVDSVIQDAATAVQLRGSSVATVSGSHLTTGTVGISTAGTSQASIRDTVLTGYAAAAVHATESSAVSIDGGLVSDSLVGVQADSPATVRLSDVMTSHNGTGIAGNVASFGNNRVSAGNTTDGSPASTLPLQ